MHVLNLPPAFVLSQDQTLKLKRHSGVSLTFEPQHITSRPVLGTGCAICFPCPVSTETWTTSNSEADPASSDRGPGRAICMDPFAESEPDRPHISSDTGFSKSRKDSQTPHPPRTPHGQTATLHPRQHVSIPTGSDLHTIRGRGLQAPSRRNFRSGPDVCLPAGSRPQVRGSYVSPA